METEDSEDGGLHKSLPDASMRLQTDVPRFPRKFGKHIQKRQLEIPEYAASFVDYKALKKAIPSIPFCFSSSLLHAQLLMSF